MSLSPPPSDPPATGPVRSGLDVAVGLAVLALLRLSVPVTSDGLILGNDVVPYAAGLAAGGQHALVNAHHLAFHPLAWLVLALRDLVTGGHGIVDALIAQSWVSALGGAATAVLLFRFARQVAGSVAALALTALFATCSANWLYGAVGESYLPATAAVTGLLVGALRVRLGLARTRVVALAGWLLLATLLRQDSVVVVVALPLLLPVGVALRVAALAGAASLATYAGVWAAFGHGEFTPWLRGLADTGNWGGGISWLKLKIGAITLQHAIHYGVRFGGAAAALSLATTVALIAAAVPGRTAAPPRGTRAALVALGVYALVRHGFFTWWQASNLEYHAGTLVPLALGLSLALAAQGAAARRGVLLVAAATALNVTGNWNVLIGPNRATDLRDQVRAGLAAAGDRPLVLSLSPLQHYAVLRDAPTEVVKRLINEEARFARPDDLAALEVELRAHLGRGKPILVLRDNVTPARLNVAEQRLEGDLLTMLYGLGTVETLAGDDADVWGLVIAPAQ